MANHTLSAMRQSIIDGAPDTASTLAQEAVTSGMAPIDAINNGFVAGMHDVGEQFDPGTDVSARHDGLRRSDAGRYGRA